MMTPASDNAIIVGMNLPPIGAFCTRGQMMSVNCSFVMMSMNVAIFVAMSMKQMMIKASNKHHYQS